jgi:hypothetical protein
MLAPWIEVTDPLTRFFSLDLFTIWSMTQIVTRLFGKHTGS